MVSQNYHNLSHSKWGCKYHLIFIPLQTKDRKWQNYYPGKDGVTMHLSGGWMINIDTYELTQIASGKDDGDSSGNSQFPIELLEASSDIESQKFY